ncbi:cation:proton antiporter [Intestinibacillus massiliensis]|nr:cation:proton antiporter [Intestinibacillus massiliensis]
MLFGLISQKHLASQVILSLSIMLFAGFLVTRLTKKLHLPNVTGYLLAGILIGPYLLGAIPPDIVTGMDFVTDMALSFIAFEAGKYFKFSTLRRNGSKTVVITLFESLVAMAVVTLSMIFIFRLPVPFSLLIGAVGCATAPASTIMTIRQYHAHGEFVDTILEVVALDDAVALIAFSVCTAVLQAIEAGGAFDPMVVVTPVLLNIAAVLLGIGMAFILNRLINEKRSPDHKLALSTAFLLALTGLCSAFDISPLLACMAMGAAYINLSGNKALFKQVSRFAPPVLLLFFVLSGMKLNIPALKTAGVIGVSYFFLRILGKYIGAFSGCALCKSPASTRNWLGLALIPQAGVSIGLAALSMRLLPPASGTLLSTIILSSAVLYEMVGPACAKASLFLSHTLTTGDRPAKVPAPDPEDLPEPEPAAAPPQPGKKKKKAKK